MEVAHGVLARAGELVVGKGAWNRNRHPSRSDVEFKYNSEGQPIRCFIHFVNSKAKGPESLRKLRVCVPMEGASLRPGTGLC